MTKDILDVHRYLMEETWYKIMFGFIKKMLIGLLSAFTIGRFGEPLVSSSKGPINYFSKQPTMSS